MVCRLCPANVVWNKHCADTLCIILWTLILSVRQEAYRPTWCYTVRILAVGVTHSPLDTTSTDMILPKNKHRQHTCGGHVYWSTHVYFPAFPISCLWSYWLYWSQPRPPPLLTLSLRRVKRWRDVIVSRRKTAAHYPLCFIYRRDCAPWPSFISNCVQFCCVIPASFMHHRCHLLSPSTDDVGNTLLDYFIQNDNLRNDFLQLINRFSKENILKSLSLIKLQFLKKYLSTKFTTSFSFCLARFLGLITGGCVDVKVKCSKADIEKECTCIMTQNLKS